MHDNREMKILTNHPGQKESPTWAATSMCIFPAGWGLGSAFNNALRLYAEAVRRQYDCIVLGAGHGDGIFSLLKALLPLKIPPLIRIECLWYVPKGWFRSKIKRMIMKIQDRGVDAYIVWARREIDAYSREFGLPREKFHFIPYHNTIHGFWDPPTDMGYIFSGGNFGRDYETLFRAVQGLDVAVKIAATRPEIFHGLRIPSNVEINGYGHEEYLRVMAGCSINVVALAGGYLHSGGQQTIINSMTMGKPTIATDYEGGKDYIDDGVDGILVPPGDSEKLRESIVFLLNNPSRSSEIGRRAMERATTLTTEAHFRLIIRFAKDLCATRTATKNRCCPVKN